MLKLKYLTEEEYEACRTVRRLFRRAKKDLDRLDGVRRMCDLNKDKDPGGEKWKDATAELWELADRLDKEGGIDASDRSRLVMAYPAE